MVTWLGQCSQRAMVSKFSKIILSHANNTNSFVSAKQHHVTASSQPRSCDWNFRHYRQRVQHYHLKNMQVNSEPFQYKYTLSQTPFPWFLSLFSCHVHPFPWFLSLFSCHVHPFTWFLSLFSCHVHPFTWFLSLFSSHVHPFPWFLSLFSCHVHPDWIPFKFVICYGVKFLSLCGPILCRCIRYLLR